MIEILSYGTAILGLFMVLPLLVWRRQRQANAWLALFVLSIALLCVAGEFTIRGHNTTWFGLLDWPVTCLGAFYYLYVREMVGLPNGRAQAWHFLPLGIFVGVLAWSRLVMGLPQPPFFAFAVFLAGCQALAAVYAALSLYRLYHYRQRLRQSYSSLQDRDLNWLVWLSSVAIGLLVAWVPAVQFEGLWAWILVLGRLAMLYFIGWYGIRQSMVFLPPLPAESAPELDVPLQDPAPAEAGPTVAAAEAAEAAAEASKYARSGLTDSAQALIKQRLKQRMEQSRDFLENDLTLNQLAERIGTSPQWLSQVLNDGLGLSFFDYVNSLRVAEVQRLLADPAQTKTPVLDLAFEAGFNSKSTFNAAFRDRTGTTPSAWRRQATVVPPGRATQTP